MTSRFDSATLDAYSQHAARYSQEWLDQPPPNDLYALLETHLVPHGKTAEIGCGNGRDAAWLAAQGYDVTGFDAAEGLLPKHASCIRRSCFARRACPRSKRSRRPSITSSARQ